MLLRRDELKRKQDDGGLGQLSEEDSLGRRTLAVTQQGKRSTLHYQAMPSDPHGQGEGGLLRELDNGHDVAAERPPGVEVVADVGP